MSSSANTFGTFLQTFGDLEKQSNSSAEAYTISPTLKDVVGVVKDIAKRGDKSLVKDLWEAADSTKAQVLAAVLGGKDQGLIELSEEHGESIAKLTTLGKLFSN